ncbi:MAG TPA: exopolysaccharide Pel transporter PelG, partial [Rectinemataceae bacterium]|nr:exopolysaccharide Pel transporter PelG [Rectinemataceae bacterium]
LLLSVVNVLWAATMTVTVVRRYVWILVAYISGMGLMYAMARAAGPSGGAADLVLALAAGYALATLFLVGASLSALGHKSLPKMGALLLDYAWRYKNLALAGLLYSIATWADKIVLALHSGSAAQGSHFLVNPRYDSAFFYANLALIPGLVFFTIVTETEFSLNLKHLVVSLAKRRLPEIAAASRRIRYRSASNLALQSGFQVAMIFGFALAAPYLSGELDFEATVFIRILVSGFFQLAFLTGLTILFYLELYKRAAIAAFAFATLDLLLSVANVAAGSEAYLGLPYLISIALASALCLAFAFTGLRSFDQILFLRATGEAYGR